MRPRLIIATLLSALGAFATDKPVVTFTENKGQWPENVLYRCLVPGGALFVEKNAFTFSLASGGPLAHHGEAHDGPEEPLRAHAYRVTFDGSVGGRGEGADRQGHYENFFLGADPASWGSRCAIFGEVFVRDLYPGIDLHIDGSAGLKYEFILDPAVDPSIIRMRYEGQDALQLRNGQLVVGTSVGPIVDEAPTTWVQNATPGISHKTIVPSAFALSDRTVRFTVDPYDPSGALTIDPELSFASLTGSTANNFGCTATYDEAGHLYGGGTVFGLGYPTTLGALSEGFNGGIVDIGISKWSPDGSALLWSTYLGGVLGNESPHSLVVNSSDELYVLASTGSSDFPTTPGCLDNVFHGGPSLIFFQGPGYDHPLGVDIAVAHLSADASTLLGSTYIGGTGTDGVNNSVALAWNYGDSFRGEIALNPQEHPLIATTTNSTDLPVSAGAPQSAFGGGGQDAYLCRLDPGMTTLEWGTYHGGSGDDAGYGVQLASNGEIFTTGGTTSADLPSSGIPWDNTANGGVDGFIARYSPDGTVRLSTTFLGTPAFDQSYLVQLDIDDGVYAVGQTHGAYPVTPGKYANPGSSQFIHKFSPDLSTSLWSTVIGNGNGDEDISPSAFLVSDCGQIFFCGWGGVANVTNGQAFASTTIGLPITPDAFQSTTNNGDFYLMVLDPEATGLNYATYFGGATSHEHVDGGTSRFDKHGNVYQAVCAGCGGMSDFPTTPNAWSNTNNSSCNLGVFKFNLSQPVAQIAIDGPGHVCLPGNASFLNFSSGGTDHLWDFGDQTGSTEFEPVHTYEEPGEFTVTMILSDSNGCLPNDTASITVDVLEVPTASVDPAGPSCQGASLQLHAAGDGSFAWFPPDGLNDPAIPDPSATLDSAITYAVVVTNVCGSDTATVSIEVGPPFGQAAADTVICVGSSVALSAEGGGAYLWSPSASLDDPTSQTPTATPSDTTFYVVAITTPEGCHTQDTLVVSVQFGVPDPYSTDTAVCLGHSVQLHVSGGDSYLWEPGEGLSGATSAQPDVAPTSDQWYRVTLTNQCGSAEDSVFVDVQEVIANAWPDTTVCPGQPVTLRASGGIAFQWSPAQGLSDPDSSMTQVSVGASTTFTVVVANALGCSADASTTVHTFPSPFVNASPDTGIDFGGSTQLEGAGDGLLVWSPSGSLSCDTCTYTEASPEHTTTYVLEVTDANGCKATDAVTVFVNGSLYVPNTFTPDGDGINDAFVAFATEIAEFRLLVFNRWGEQIYQADQLGRAWDGTYGGIESPIDTYVWRVDLKELNGKRRTVFGHVNLIR